MKYKLKVLKEIRKTYRKTSEDNWKIRKEKLLFKVER